MKNRREFIRDLAGATLGSANFGVKFRAERLKFRAKSQKKLKFFANF